VLKEEFAPVLSNSVRQAPRTPFAVQMANDIVLTDCVPKLGEERPDITTAVWNHADKHTSFIMALKLPAKSFRLLLLIGANQYITARPVDDKPTQKVFAKLWIKAMIVNRNPQCSFNLAL
jgi:hypothetical protein